MSTTGTRLSLFSYGLHTGLEFLDTQVGHLAQTTTPQSEKIVTEVYSVMGLHICMIGMLSNRCNIFHETPVISTPW